MTQIPFPTNQPSPLQVAEIGGWLATYGSIVAMDRELDKDSSLNHQFLDQRANLVSMKTKNPSARIQSAADVFGSEVVKAKESKRQGLKAPKKKFYTLRAFKKKWPNKVVDPNAVRTHVVDGERVEGIDVIMSEASGKGYWDSTQQHVESCSFETEQWPLSCFGLCN